MIRKKNPTIIFGAGGASKEVYGLIKHINLSSQEYDVLGFVEKNQEQVGRLVCDSLSVVASDETIGDYLQNYDSINVVIPIAEPIVKEKIYSQLCIYKNVEFPNIIHPGVTYHKEQIDMGFGNILCAGAIIGWELKTGNFNYINRSCNLGHDLIIGNFNTINPMAAISGNVTIGNKNIVGSGAIVLQGITIKDNNIIGAGAVLTKNVISNEILVGIPARIKDR